MRRQRNRNNGGGHGGGNNPNAQRRPAHNRMQVFDSNGPDVRIRGTAYQIVEKYIVLAKDSASSGDRILEQSYLQHAEHYQRVINVWEEAAAQERSVAGPHHHSDAPPATVRSHAEDAQGNSGGAGEDLGLPQSILGASRPAQGQQQNEMAE